MVALGSIPLLVAGCGHDRADQAHLAALAGQEKGMSIEQQMALVDQAISLEPRRPAYYETRAGYWIALRRFDRARSDLDRDIALVDRPYARFMRGLVACQAREFERSLVDFDQAIARQPENTQFYRGRSLARAALGDAAGALEDAEHLVTVVPQQAESWYARGVARALLKRHLGAIDDFDRAAALRPELVYVVEAREKSLRRIGETGRALLDREWLDQARVERAGCAPCLDPFRY